jgi:hypothetical protein
MNRRGFFSGLRDLTATALLEHPLSKVLEAATPPVAPIALGDLNRLLMKHCIEPMRDILNQESALARLLSSRDEPIEGRNAIIPLCVHRETP